MNFRLFFFLPFLIVSLISKSQCLVPSIDINGAINSATSNSQDTYCLKLYFHIVSENDQFSITSTDVDNVFGVLTGDFDKHKIFFYFDRNETDFYPNQINGCPFDIINNDDGIDIFLLEVPANEEELIFSEAFANGIGLSTQLNLRASTFRGIPTLDSKIISHEMGHVLGLYHTHYGTGEPGGCPEIDGVNGETCGDFIEDTPADPNMKWNVDPNTCVWNRNVLGYNPDVGNIMSYSHPNCYSNFSPKQVERMKKALNSLDHLKVLNTTPVEEKISIQKSGDLTMMGSTWTRFNAKYEGIPNRFEWQWTVSGSRMIKYGGDFILVENNPPLGYTSNSLTVSLRAINACGASASVTKSFGVGIEPPCLVLPCDSPIQPIMH